MSDINEWRVCRFARGTTVIHKNCPGELRNFSIQRRQNAITCTKVLNSWMCPICKEIAPEGIQLSAELSGGPFFDYECSREVKETEENPAIFNHAGVLFDREERLGHVMPGHLVIDPAEHYRMDRIEKRFKLELDPNVKIHPEREALKELLGIGDYDYVNYRYTRENIVEGIHIITWSRILMPGEYAAKSEGTDFTQILLGKHGGDDDCGSAS